MDKQRPPTPTREGSMVHVLQNTTITKLLNLPQVPTSDTNRYCTSNPGQSPYLPNKWNDKSHQLVSIKCIPESQQWHIAKTTMETNTKYPLFAIYQDQAVAVCDGLQGTI